MPKFLTISPSHEEGKKPYAWNNFLSGGYIAIGWMHVDLTGKSKPEIDEIIRSYDHPRKRSAPDALRKFLALSIGDYVAVTNAGAGLFGIGVVTSGYIFDKHRHDPGTDIEDHRYSHIRKVDWKVSTYHRREELLRPNEKGWQPYGTVGALLDSVPSYITRVLEGQLLAMPQGSEARVPEVQLLEPPDWLAAVTQDINTLRSDPHHSERAHESLVERFLVALGYARQEEIKFQQGRIDVVIQTDGKALIIFEVKKAWDLGPRERRAVEQALVYASREGVRYFAITNGDYYRLYDRTKGLSLDDHFSGEFRLSRLREVDLAIIESLRPARLKSS